MTHATSCRAPPPAGGIAMRGESASFGWNNRCLPSFDSHANGPLAPRISRSDVFPSADTRHRSRAAAPCIAAEVDPAPVARPGGDMLVARLRGEPTRWSAVGIDHPNVKMRIVGKRVEYDPAPIG